MLFLSIFTSLDGYIEDEAGGIEWMSESPEFDAYVMEVLSSIDGMIFGRKAHGLLAQFWPTSELAETELMNRLPKYALTRSGRCAEWENSHPIDVEGVRALKAKASRDIALFAGAEAAQALMTAGLVDELRIIVNPIVLGGGKAPFAEGPRLPLSLEEARPLGGGMVLLRYMPKAT